MLVDADVLAAFKTQAEKPGAVPYQTRMNQVLRAHLEAPPMSPDRLVEDERLIGRLAERLAEYKRQRGPDPRRKAART